MKRIIECVPNYSEGRDRGVIDAIVAAIGAVEGVKAEARTHHFCRVLGKEGRCGETTKEL